MDQDFDPALDSYINELDDEQTLEEEENLSESMDNLKEIEKLKQESEMPIEALLKMYKYDTVKSSTSHNSNYQKNLNSNDDNDDDDAESSSYDEEEDDDDDDDEEEDDDEDDDDTNNENKSAEIILNGNKLEKEIRKEAIDDVQVQAENNINTNSLKRAQIDLYNLMNNTLSGDEDDGDFDPESFEIRKKIKIGNEYQMELENFCKKMTNEERSNIVDDYAELLWSPFKLDENCVIDYLKTISNCFKENEEALVLLNKCNYNIEIAIKQYNELKEKENKINVWTDEQNELFEECLREYGKDFSLIQKKKFNDLTVGQLVTYYYVWKKSEKHDIFVNNYRIKRKPFIINAVTTDFMERFMFEREQSLATINPSSTSSLFTQKLTENTTERELSTHFESNSSNENKHQNDEKSDNKEMSEQQPNELNNVLIEQKSN